jgi:hypothetical protein
MRTATPVHGPSYPGDHGSVDRFRVLGLAAPLLLASCANVFQARSFDVPVDSIPHGADVLVDGIKRGVTPCVVTYPRTVEPLLTLSLEGYYDQPVAVGNKSAPIGLVLLDILFLPVLIIDVLAKADWPVCTDPILVHLTKKGENPPIVWRRENYDPNGHPRQGGGAR